MARYNHGLAVKRTPEDVEAIECCPMGWSCGIVRCSSTGFYHEYKIYLPVGHIAAFHIDLGFVASTPKYQDT
jgi:hypothetical protein